MPDEILENILQFTPTVRSAFLSSVSSNTKMFDFTVLQRDALPCSNGPDNIEISQRSKDAEILDIPCIVEKKENSRHAVKTVSHPRDWQANHVHFSPAIPRGHPGE